MRTTIKVQLHDIEGFFNAGYLYQHSNTGIELLITTGQRHLK